MRCVGTAGFEPTASCSQSRHSTRLSYVPRDFRYQSPANEHKQISNRHSSTCSPPPHRSPEIPLNNLPNAYSSNIDATSKTEIRIDACNSGNKMIALQVKSANGDETEKRFGRATSRAMDACGMVFV